MPVLIPLRMQKGYRLGGRALLICRDCVLAAHKTLGFPCFLLLDGDVVEWREVDGRPRSCLKDFVFCGEVGFLLYGFKGRGAVFCRNENEFALFFGERKVLQGRFCGH